MTMRDLFIIAAAAAFSLAGVASVNNSEAINVTLPSQYRTVWDQSVYSPGVDGAGVARPSGGLRTGAWKQGSVTFGRFARIVSRHWANRG